MRILSGIYRGRTIKMPKGIRPTQDKVRKALFDILKNCIEGAGFLDLFAGSGAIGIEALSRGAKEVLFVENNRGCLKIVKQNLSLLSSLSYRVIELEVSAAIKKFCESDKKFDVIFLDPPYYKDMAKNTLQCLSDYDILHPNSLVAVQHYKKDQLPNNIGKLVLWRRAFYGDTVISFYRKED